MSIIDWRVGGVNLADYAPFSTIDNVAEQPDNNGQPAAQSDSSECRLV